MSELLQHVVETTSETFERDAIAKSKEVPVLVDFWAGWCQPCRLLGPVLERLAGEYQGRFVLVKADTEQLPDIASAFGVRSIPAVYALKDGRIVDSFVGVLPEAALRGFIDALMPTAAELAIAEARKLAAGDPAKAESLLHEAHTLAPTDPRPRIALAEFLLGQERLEECLAEIVELERRGFLEPEAETIKAELTLRAGARDAGGDVEHARQASAADPGNLGLKLKLAEALAADGQHAEALEIGLDLVERDRQGTGEEARKLMLALFNLLPPGSELVADFRRRLSLVL